MGNTAKQLLFIGYAYPPTGGAGVQRSVKFTKYLPQFGWCPTVLTVSNPSVPVSDMDLLDDVSKATRVVRARTLEPSYAVKGSLVSAGPPPRFPIKSLLRRACMKLLQPDPQVLWNPLAYRLGKRTLKEQPCDAIFVTGPPFSSFLLGRSLKFASGLPLVLDFRDEWLLASRYLDNHQRSGLSGAKQQNLFYKVLRAADAVITTTQASRREIIHHVSESGGQASVTCIYNGYDEDDFASLSPANENQKRLRIVYTGTLWKLTDASPMVAALKDLVQRDVDIAQGIELVIVGRRTPEQDAVIEPLRSLPIDLVVHDYLPHKQSLAIAASADVLLLLLADQEGADRVVPAKLFEYLALRKNILAICGEGEMAELLRAHGQGCVLTPHQPSSISDWLHQQLRSHPSESANDSVISAFSRRELTGQLATVLDDVIRI